VADEEDEEVTLSVEDFAAIRCGDILLWRESKLRTVLEGPADRPQKSPTHGGITFPKIGNSWTGRPVASYDYCAIRDLVRVTGKRRTGLVSKAEMAALRELGFGPPDIERELVFWEELAERCRKNPCRALRRAIKSIRG